MTPCRALDTRTVGNGRPVVGVGKVDVVASGCLPSAPPAYVTNATVVPTTSLAFLDVYDPSLGVPSVKHPARFGRTGYFQHGHCNWQLWVVWLHW